MKKQLHRSIFKAVLLSVFLLCTVLWAASGIVADTGDVEYRFSMTFDPTAVNSCTVVVTDPSNASTTYVWTASGQSIMVPLGSKVEVTLSLKPGKIADHLTNNPQPIQDNKITWNALYADTDVELICINRTYPVKLLGPNGSGAITYVSTDPNLTIQQFLSGSFEYQAGSGVRVELPVVSLEGYRFKGWHLVTGGDETSKEPIQADPTDGKYYIPSDRSNFYFDTQNAVYVYPEMEPEEYLIWRQDCIWDAVNGMASTLLAPNYSQSAKYDSTYSALYAVYGDTTTWKDDPDGSFKQYPGFLLKEDAVSTDYVAKKVLIAEAAAKTNQVKRYYLPILYTLTYWDDNGEQLPEGDGYRANGTYQYATKTDIAQPTRLGYDFLGWTVEVYRDGQWIAVTPQSEDQNSAVSGITKPDFSLGHFSLATLASGGTDENALYASEQNTNADAIEYEIRLTANWKATEYSITYDWALGADADADLLSWMTQNNGEVLSCDSFVYDTATDIPSPVRPGYTFCAWKLWRAEKGTDVWVLVEGVTLTPGEDGKVQIPNYAYDLKLEATWNAESYQVLLDPNGGTSGEKTELTATYDQLLSISESDLSLILPSRAGYSFTGFFSAPEGGVQYINADGTAVTDRLWQEDGGADGSTVTLYAQWVPKPYDVTIDFGAVEGVVITITPEGAEPFPYNGPFQLTYGTGFTVTVSAPAGYKVTAFDGDIEDTVQYTTELTVGVWESGQTFTVKILPIRTFASLPGVDYRAEELTGLIPGDTYLICPEGATAYLSVLIPMGSDRCPIEDAWFGKTLSIIYCGDENNFADSEAQTITLAARPDKPNQYDPDGTNPPEIGSVAPRGDRVDITFTAGNEGLYELAIRESGDQSALVWGSDLTGLKPGTLYHIYIRQTATDTAPHGLVESFSVRTDSLGYKDGIISDLEQLREENPGKLTEELINSAIEEIEHLAETSDNFYDDVAKLLSDLQDKKLQVAISKDQKITALEEFRDECINTGFFLDEKEQELNSICDTAIAAIKALPGDCDLSEIDNIYHPAMNAMKKVEIHLLSDTDNDVTVTLESVKGLYQDSRLNLSEQVDFATLMEAVNKAIRTPGKIAVNGFMTTEEAEEILRSLNVFASYRFELSHDDKVKDGDVFTVRLLLSDTLKGKTGLQVAYYDPNTGTIELLQTHTDGDYLVFTTNRIADFVVLADPTLELGGVIVALGAVIFCQILAIAFVLLSRHSSKKHITHASVLLPVAALTVHFSPVNSEWIALIMAITVVVLQIILMALLFSSNMILLPRKKKGKNADEEADAFLRTGTDEAYAVSTDAAAAETDREEAEMELIEEGSDDEEADDAYVAFSFSDDEETDPFAIYGEDASAEDGHAGDFIEPAVTTRYSLPDDADTFFYDEEADTEEADAEVTDAETDPYTYDDEEAVDAALYEEYAEDDADDIADEETEGEEPVAEDTLLSDPFLAFAYDESGDTAYADTMATEAYADTDEEELYSDEEEVYSDEELYSDEEVYSDEEEVYSDEELYSDEEVYSDEEELYSDEDAAYSDDEGDDPDDPYRYDE